jgi:hypothetical protein
MGRFVKNTELKSGSTAIRVPVGTTARRPEVPIDGQLRMNTTLSRVEMYFSGEWHSIAKVGRVNLDQQEFTTNVFATDGNGSPISNRYGDLSYRYDGGEEGNVLVYVGGVKQTPNVHYQFLGNFQFDLAPTDPTPGVTILVVHNANSTDAYGS